MKRLRNAALFFVYRYSIMENKFCAEYIWIGGENELRSKTRVFTNYNKDDGFPDWDYDGSSTKQADGNNSEVILRPCAVFADPFRRENDVLVLCSTYRPDGEPLPNNHRHHAKHAFDQKPDEHPWFGLEQEYFMYNNRSRHPLGFDENGKQGQYYCSVGANNAFGREIVEEHLSACLAAGLNISGVNAEVAPGQWEFQIGICEGIEAGDHLWLARYLLERISEKHGVYINYHPKPLIGDWNGSGCHTNFSTQKMREYGGINEIYKAIELLGDKHAEHMEVYGEFNKLRLTGKHETASYTVFTHGKADRGASIRIGNKTINDGFGYFEDRRPSSNMDPYLVTAKIFETTCL
jgi:glutamine synthetase